MELIEFLSGKKSPQIKQLAVEKESNIFLEEIHTLGFINWNQFSELFESLGNVD